MSPMLLVLCVGVTVLCAARADLTLMKDVTLGFGQALDQCRQESQLTEEKMEEFFQFWHEDFKLELRELGCALHCMSQHFGLLTAAGRMHHDNTRRFISSFPNGEALSQQLVLLLHTCEQQHEAEPDQCWRVLRVADCFRSACRRDGLAPSAEVLMAEFIMDSELD